MVSVMQRKLKFNTWLPILSSLVENGAFMNKSERNERQVLVGCLPIEMNTIVPAAQVA